MNRSLKILAVLAAVFFYVQISSDNKADVDLWGNAGFVKAMPWNDGFNYLNTFSFTEPDYPWINHEWLGQYIMHGTWKVFGDTGLLTLKILLGVCTLSILLSAAWKQGVSGTLLFLYTMLVLSTIGYGFSTRPHHFTYLMYAVFLLLLHRYSNSRVVMMVVLPLTAMLWANLHGAFFIGPCLMFIFAFANLFCFSPENPRTPAWLPFAGGGAVCAATFVNPYGIRLWSFIFQSAAKSRPYLSEWAPFNPFTDFTDHVDFVALTLLSIIAIVFSKRHKSIPWQAIFWVSLVAAVVMRRNIPLFALTTALVVPRHVEDAAGKHVGRIISRIHPRALAAALVVFIAVSAWYTAEYNKKNPLRIEIPPERFPVETIAFMKQNEIAGNALVFFDWAEYCIWHLYPDTRVFLDGRFRSAYSPETIDDYLNFLYPGQGWKKAIENYKTDIVLVHKDSAVSKHMIKNGDWTLVFKGPVGNLFLKTSLHGKLLPRLTDRANQPHITEANYYFP